MALAEYVELELRGNTEAGIAFVEGLRLACPRGCPVWYSRWERIAGESWLETLRAKIGASLHVVLSAELADRVQESLDATDVVPVEAAGRWTVTEAAFDFEFRCYSRREGAAIRRLVEDELPTGLELVDYRVEETLEDSARGVELYAPLHDYELRGTGRYRGSVPAVFEMVHRLAEQTFIHAGKVQLERAK